MTKYLITVKRSARKECPTNWQEQINEMDEVTIIPLNTSKFFKILKITATSTGKQTIENKLGQYLHIEPELKRNIF